MFSGVINVFSDIAHRANTLQFLNHDINYTIFSQKCKHPTICTYVHFENWNVKVSSTAADHIEIAKAVVKLWCGKEM